MNWKYFFIFLAIAAVFSCSKEGNNGNTYIVSASKMIGLTGNNWSNVEVGLKFKKGYQYSKAPENLNSIIKAEVHLPAVDDSNRNVKGSILLNIAPDNTIFYSSFDTDPIPQATAYAMMQQYNRETLQTLTGISFSIGEVVENNVGGNTTVSTVVSKLASGQTADQLAIIYTSGQGSFTMVIFRQNDGSYVFSYRGSH